MPLIWTLGVLLLAVLAAAPLTRSFQREAGVPLALAYLGAAAVFTPAAGTVLAGGTVTWSMSWVPALQVNLSLRADGLGVVFGFIALLIGAVVLAYSAAYLPPGRQLSFYLVMAAFTLSMVLLVLADDLVLLFIGWELTSLASFLLIARGGTGGEPASMRTLLVTVVGGLSLLGAVAAIIARTGTTSVSQSLADPVWQTDSTFTGLVAALVLTAAFTKSAQFPFHVWLPDAMAAATPVSAYLHAAAVVKAGIFLLMRFTPAFHATPLWNYTLIGVGLFTAFLGALFALRQTDLKKLMAYSTVSQLGLIVGTIGVGTEAALAAAVFHTIAHALFKSGLFMMVGVIDHAAHTRDLRRLPPLARAMPFSFTLTILGCASMAGVPPMLGFASKEGVLAALRQAPGPAWVGWVALLAAAGGAVLTVAYCGRIVFGGFVDGQADRPVSPPELPVVGPAAIPLLAGAVLAFLLPVLENPVAQAAAAALPGTQPYPHLSLWHGVGVELVATMLVLAVGAVLIARQRRVTVPMGRRGGPAQRDGAYLIQALHHRAQALGTRASRLVAADHPRRHVAPIFGMLVVVLAAGVVSLTTAGTSALPDRLPEPMRWSDLMLLVLLTGSVLVVCHTRARIAATVALGAVGILATVQLFSLGAPDVGLTQLLVESMTVIMIMLVLQKLPRAFPRPSRRRSTGTVLLAVAMGAAATAATWALTGRRERSPVAGYYLTEAPEVSGGDNIVNVILVEFRALDTLGELAVLGFAGIAMIAVVSTLQHRFIDPDQHTPAPVGTVPASGSTAHRALHQAWGNAVPLQLTLRVVGPLLVVASAVLFWRGHNAPGGGFIAALVGAAVVGLAYLSTSRDRQIGPPRLPLHLVGGGVLVAIGAGAAGLAVAGSFLEPRHGYLAGQHVSTSLIFDAGVYAAVLGLILVGFNLLGASEHAGSAPGEEGIRERADETVEGELPGPLDTVRGEHPAPSRVGVGSRHLLRGIRPKEPGR